MLLFFTPAYTITAFLLTNNNWSLLASSWKIAQCPWIIMSSIYRTCLIHPGCRGILKCSILHHADNSHVFISHEAATPHVYPLHIEITTATRNCRFQLRFCWGCQWGFESWHLYPIASQGRMGMGFKLCSKLHHLSPPHTQKWGLPMPGDSTRIREWVVLPLIPQQGM